MNPREISARLHDILRTACRVRQPGPGTRADAGLMGLDEVKAGIRDLIRAVGDDQAPQVAPRIRASAGAFPEGRIAGTRALVQHRRRVRGQGEAALSIVPGSGPGTPSPIVLRLPSSRSAREAAEAHFAPSPSLDAAAV